MESDIIVKCAGKDEVVARLVTGCEAVKSKKAGGQILDKEEDLIGLVTRYEPVKCKKVEGQILSKRKTQAN